VSQPDSTPPGNGGNGGNGGNKGSGGNRPVKSGVEIAWARAVARAFDDPAYYRSLKANPKKALRDLGADVRGLKVKRAIKDGDLKPSLKKLNKSIRALERKRSALAGAGRPTYQAPGAATWQPTQSGVTSCGTPYPAAVHLHLQPYAFSALPRYAGSTCMQPQGYWGSPGMLPGSPCIAFSQVATTRASATRGTAPPQWIGGPPSGADGST